MSSPYARMPRQIADSLSQHGTHEYWPFYDPAKFVGDDAQRIQETRRVRDQIEERLRGWLTEQGIAPKEYR
jgi:hypothetical protein